MSGRIVDASIKEFVVVHNGIITNYKDIKQFLVSRTQRWRVGRTSVKAMADVFFIFYQAVFCKLIKCLCVLQRSLLWCVFVQGNGLQMAWLVV